MNHFHNPLKPSFTEPGATDFGTLVERNCRGEAEFWPPTSAARWGTRYTDAQTKGDATRNLLDWDGARAAYLRALTLTDRLDREGALGRTFKLLGHVVHLVQDMAVPAHVRSDFRAHLVGRGELSFEPGRWRANPFERFVRLNPKSVGEVAPVRLDFTGQRVTRFWDTDQYDGTNPSADTQQGLAEYTNANFLSENTIFNSRDPQYRFPFPRPEGTNLAVYLADPARLPVGTCQPRDGILDQVRYLAKQIDGEVVYPFLRAGYLTFDLSTGLPLPPPGQLALQLDDCVHAAYAALLLPRAIGYSAGLLDYFFRGRLAVFAPPNTTNKLRVRNLSDEPIDGWITLYWDGDQGRQPLGTSFPVTLGPRRMAQGKDNPASVSTAVLFTPKTDAKGRYVAVFTGTLGQESGAVIGRVLGPRLAFTGTTCAQPDPQDPTKCGLSVAGLYRVDLPSPGAGSQEPGITALTQRQEGDNFEDRLAAWAPDGSQLAFASTRGGSGFTLWFMDADGTNARQAIEQDAQGNPIGPILLDGRPAWSPDGTQLVFARRTGTATMPEDQLFGQRDLFLYDLTQGTVQRLTGTNRDTQLTLYDFIHPAWSPDGTTLVVATVAVDLSNDPQGCGPKARNYELRLVSPTGNLGRWLTCHPDSGALLSLNDAEALNPAWTPDGQGVVFAQTASQPPEAGTDLWLVQPAAQPDATTKTPPRTRLTQGVATDPVLARPTVAPDGKTVALASKLTTAPHIYAFDYAFDQIPPAPAVTPAQATCLTCTSPFSFQSATQPAWSPGLP